MHARSFFFALLLCLSGLFAGASQAQDYQVSTLATGLDKPWSITSIGEGTFLVTEKSGRLVRLDADGNVTTIQGTPPVYFANQGGLLEVLADTDFASNKLIYLSFAGGDKSANRTTVVKATLSGDTLNDVETILEVAPDKEGPAHYGGKLATAPFTFWQLAFTGAVAGVGTLFSGVSIDGEPVEWTSDLLLALFYLGVLATGLAIGVQAKVQPRIKPTHVALLFALQPLFGALAGWLFLDDRLGATQWIGGGMIVSAVVLAARDQS